MSGFLAPLPSRVRLSLFVLGSVVILLSKHGPLSKLVRLPENRRQIPSDVFTAGLARGAYRFGVELGLGVRTYVPSAAPYLLVLGILLLRLDLAAALLVGMTFGVGRAVPLLLGVARARARQLAATSAFPALGRYASRFGSLVVLTGSVRLAS